MSRWSHFIVMCSVILLRGLCACSPASVVIVTILYQRSCWLGRLGILEVDYAQGQLHSSRAEHPLIQCEAPATRLNRWSWEVEGQPFVYTLPAEIQLLEKGEVDL